MALRKDLLALLLILILGYFAVLPLFSTGIFTMHDDQQVARLYELDKALKAGQFPVRWVDGFGFGFGYALFNFYPPLTYYAGEAIHLVMGLGFVDSVKAVWFLALLGSGIGMYFLSKEFFGRTAGLVSALFYIYAPYHAVDAFVRGALAELSSFVWLPLILLFALKSVKTNQFKYAFLTGIFLALLMLTHNLIFLPFLGIFAIWYAMLVFTFNRGHILIHLLQFALVVFVAFTLSAFFWLPSLYEKQFTLVDGLLIKSLALYKIHFVCPTQLWDSPWGFGGSVSGCIDGISFKIGKLHILVSLLAIALAIIFKKSRILISIIFSLLLVSIFMTTERSSVIWDNIKVLWYLQFPWRFLEFVVLFSSLLAGSLMIFVRGKFQKSALAVALIFSLIFLNAKLFQPQVYLPDATDKEQTSERQIKWHVSSTSFEFMPKGVATKITDLGTLWIDIDEAEIPNEKLKIKSGDFKVQSSRFVPGRFSFQGHSGRGAEIEIQTTYFPGWKVWLDGNKLQVSDYNKYKLMTVFVPAGDHKVTGEFTNTPVRMIANLITLSALIILIFIFIATRSYGFRRNSKQDN